jgi:small conductance mechanosensitive channel
VLKQCSLQILSVLFALLVIVQPIQAADTSASPQTDNYQALADALSDPASRDELINKLRELSKKPEASAADNAAEESQADPSAVSDEKSMATEVAEKSQSVVETVVTTVSGSWEAVQALAKGEGKKITDFFVLLLNVAVVIAVTLGTFWLLRGLARVLFRFADTLASAEGRAHPYVAKATAIVLSVVTDIAVVAVAWLAGYGVALFLVGDVGEVAISQTLFLNVFLVVELFKVVLRGVFAGRDPALRLLPMTDDNARYWSAFLSAISSLVGYGVLFVVPLVSEQLSANLGDLLNLLIVLIAVAAALTIVNHKRKQVKEGLLTLAQESDFSVNQVTLGVLARSWHWFAMIYTVVLGAALLLNPEQALPSMMLSTLQTVLAIFIGMGVIGLLELTIGNGVHLPVVFTSKLSTLETRVNNFLPILTKVLKFIVLLMVISAILDAWGAVDLPTWMASPFGLNIISSAVSVLFILATSMLIWIVLASWIEHRLNPDEGSGEPSAREKTLLTIFRNAVAITIIVMTLMIVLSEIGINIGPLLAGAGVLGLAIGFGAQKLVQDVITGVFIQMENAINAGDIVTVSGITGVAEKLTIRSLGLRDLSGTYHLVPFSSVDTVSNYMREFAYHVGEYGVAYREDTDEVIIKLRDAFAELLSDDEQRAKLLCDELEVHGVTALADSSVNIRVRIKTLPGSQWGVGREYNRLVKRHLDAAGIEIPFPHLTLYFGEDKQGHAPAMPLKMINEVEVVSDAPSSDSSPKLSKEPSAKTNPSEKGDYDDGE